MPPDLNTDDLSGIVRVVRQPVTTDPTRVADMVLGELGRAALEQSGRRWSGAELVEEINSQARVLRDLGVGAGTRVALRVALGHDYLVGLLAAFLCGASVIPTDPEDDWVWLASARVCGPSVLITSDGCVSVAGPPAPSIPGEAWLLPTSGSTGRPRIVVGSANGLLERLEWGKEWFAIPDVERCAVLSPGTFIDALTHSLQTLAAGRVLVLPPERRDHGGAWLKPFLIESGLHQLVCVPSVLPPLASDPGFRMPELIRWVLSGELLRARGVGMAQRIAPRAQILNSYGSTEVTGDVAVSAWAPGADVPDPVPVGHVQGAIPWSLVTRAPGTEVLRFGGDQVALAVLGAEEDISTDEGVRWFDTGDTADVTEDGLTITGRASGGGGFAKVRGWRVDLALVEAGLESLPGVRQAMALAATGPLGTDRLLGFVAADQELPDWRIALRAQVPASHVPDRLIVVAALPRTPSGKVDQAAALLLSRRVDTRGTGFVDAVATVAAGILGVVVAPHEPLADAGLDSLSAVAVAAALEEAFGVPCAPEDLFREGCLAELAAFMLAQPVGDDRSIRCLRAAGARQERPPGTPVAGRSQATSPAPRSAGGPPVLVLFPPAVGTSLGFVRLVSLLHFGGQIDTMEYGSPELQALDDGGQEALAHRCANQIESRHPGAPVVCLGWSFGAAVAVRCQIELAGRGLDTPHVILLDPALLGSGPGDDLEAWARARLWEDSSYTGPVPSGPDAFLRAVQAGGRLSRVHPQRIEAWLRTLAATRRAASEGFSRPPTTSVTILRARPEPLLTYPAWLRDPDPLRTVIDIDSTHFGLLSSRALPIVAATVDSALERATAGIDA